VPTAVAHVPSRAAARASRWVDYRRARWPTPIGNRPAVTLGICAIFRDEARYLAEWVTFHRLQGVERFYLYNNLSNDDWRLVLAPELATGVAEVMDWPDEPGQFSAYADCLTRHRTDTRWIAFLDVDEFLYSPTGKGLPAILKRFDTHPAVVANWRTYGTGGWQRPPAGLVIESYLTRAPDDHPANRHVKSVVYPRQTSTWVQNPHNFRHYGRAVGEDGRAVASSFREPATTRILRINHYYSKSVDELQKKISRPRGDLGEFRKAEEAFAIVSDEVHDDGMLRYVPGVKQALAAR